MPPARHRAAGFGRYVSFTPAAPTHALPRRSSAVRRDILVGGAVAIVLSTCAGALVGVAGRDPAPPVALRLPTITMPRPTVVALVPATGNKTAIRQAAKVRPPVDLGPLGEPQLTKYCAAHAGPDTTAVSTDKGWACEPTGTLLNMNLVCRWWHGNAAWSAMTDDDDPDTWRCYRG